MASGSGTSVAQRALAGIASASFINGSLDIKVLNAKGVAAMDRGGTSDPYCIILVDGKEHARTLSIPKTVDPVWNAEFDVKLEKANRVTFQVFDKNSIGSDKLCGDADLDFHSLANGQTTSVTLPLKPDSGFLNLSVRFVSKWTSLETPEEWVNAMHHGSDLIKFTKSSTKPHPRFFRVSGDNLSLSWSSPKKAALKSRVLIDSIKEIRVGRNTKSFSRHATQHADKVDHSFSVIYGSDFETLDLVAASADEFKFWTEGLRYMSSVVGKQVAVAAGEKHAERRKRWLKEMWNMADKNKDNQLDMKEISQLLHVLNAKVSNKELKKRFAAANSDDKGTKYLDFDEFGAFYRQLTLRPEIEQLLLRYSNTEPLSLTLDEFRRFLEVEQGMAVSSSDAAALIAKHEPAVEGTKSKLLSYEGLFNFLASTDNDLFNPAHNRIYQDMSQPLTHYFVASSHNTYLLGDQLRSESSVEAYVRALQNGCRCVELDCWDGEDGDPIIYHGHTLTSKIKFSDVIKAIGDYAFATSPFPVILSIENHCSVPQQKVMAQHMETILGSKLLKGDPDELRKAYPSPNDLKNKILIKGKRSGKTGMAAGPAGPADDEDSDEEDDDDEGKVKDEAAVQAAAAIKAKNQKKVTLAPELSALVVYCKAVHFKSFDDSAANGKYWEMSSFAEAKTKKFASKLPSQLIEYNKKQLSRIYPAGTRVDSSNYDPQVAWNCGSQIVALNYQTPDRSMQLNQGKFRQNGRSGVILKPYVMRKGTNFNPNDVATIPHSVRPTKLTIKIISGQQLPKPDRQTKGEIIDPYVVVEVAGIPADQKTVRTKVIDDNGFNPEWSETFTFDLRFAELAILRFVVYDKDVNSDDFIGQYTINVSDVRSGYHHVNLESERGDPLDSGTLFAHFQVTEQ
ncbi:phospholipase C-eta2 [Capsaspora owczarzaki ATCC 30864]|uniref:Phosphoinositide phospholipase C n=1 Tax=Capsaspora owczarzaki (strain ATCC 30864) TaxID=595528 RepID=A0A0D2U0B6_CAPO3|nr:phospholipase C-eta2 [Capsaspora owczarzaki ATCC 30864]KJE88621.1 phospholipase C-eta2 [Capsaspora owczarzaki ATCC 30864]|eukprot:XP_004365118.1 phospholipase C-eta2 [Capsaspora owczarzaki ATCC 30864]